MKDAVERPIRGRILKAWTQTRSRGSNYALVSLSREGEKQKRFYVRRLVSMAFGDA